MAQQTAMQIMYDELMAHEYTIPLSLIVKCKELIEVEKEQIVMAYEWGWVNGDLKKSPSRGSDYYDETFTQQDNIITDKN